MKVDDVYLNYIQELEGYSPTAYYCTSGVRTIGYGHAILPTDDFPESITKEEALKLLKSDLSKFEHAVNAYVKVDLTQTQFVALVFLCYNIGIEAFRTSTLLKELNEGHYDEVPVQMMRWKYSKGKVSKGLIKRREAEINLWKDKSID